MQAIKVTDINKVRVDNCTIPEAGPDEVTLQVDYCGVCKTDAKIVHKGHRDLILPRIIGHECCGHVAAGFPYIIWPGKACGICELCNSGKENLCPDMQIIGFHRDGCMAEQVVVPESSLIALPADLSKKLAIFAEPLGCAINAVDQFVKADGELLISGGGTCGLLMAIAAEYRGFKPTVFEPNKNKFQKVGEFAKLAEIVNEFPTKKFDCAVNATANIDAISEGINALKVSGAYCLFSGLDKKLEIPATLLNQIHYKQLTIKGAYGCTREQMTRALSIISDNSTALEQLIEDEIKIEQVPEILDNVANGKSYRYIVKF